MRLRLLSCILLYGNLLWAQSENSIPLSEAINYFLEEKGLQFSYNPAIVDRVTLNFDYQGLEIDEFITTLNDKLPIRFEKINDQYYAVKTVESTYDLKVNEIDAKETIPAEAVTILVNSIPLTSQVAGDEVTFSYQPHESDLVEVHILGYEKALIPLERLLNQQIIEIDATPRTVQLENIEIRDYLTSGINLNPYNQSVNIKTVDLPLVPGETDGDIFASVTALPGITSPDSRAGNIYIRNSYVDQSMILYEGIPIYHRGHYFGTISPYNPKVVDEVIVHRSGFHPRLGGRVGGAIEINTNSEPISIPNFGFGANSFYGMTFAKLPLAKDKMSLSLGARHSYPGNYQSPKIEAISDMIFDGTGVEDTLNTFDRKVNTTFQDIHSKFNWQFDESNSLSVSGIFTRSLAEYRLGPSIQTEEMVENTFTNLGGHVNWQSKISSRFKSTFSVVSSNYNFKYLSDDARNEQTPDVDGTFSTNEISDFGISEELELALQNVGALQFGLDYKRHEVSYGYKSPLPIDTTLLVLQSGSASSHLFSPYANFLLNQVDKLHLQFGMRANYYTALDDFRLAPRLFANYELQNWLFLKGSAGKYYQYLSQVKNLVFSGGGFDNELWLLANKDEGNIIDGSQFMIGSLMNLGSWIIDIEAYFKRANNVTYYPAFRLITGADFFTADHKMKGIDFLVKRQVNEDISLWAGYTLSKSKVAIDTATNLYYNDKFSQPDNLTLGGSYITNRWKLSVGWRYASGLYGRSVSILPVLNNVRNSPPPPSGMPPPGAMPPPNIEQVLERVPERFDPVHSLDISASYTIPESASRKWSASLGLSLINSYNQANRTDQVVRGRPPVFVDRTAIRFAPNIMLMVEW